MSAASKLILWVVLSAIVLSGALWLNNPGSSPTSATATPVEGLLWPNPKHLQSFSLVDHHDREFGLEQFSGNWTLVFSGYSHCSDICPITLQLLAGSIEYMALGQQPIPRVAFLSLDPNRDSPEHLHEFVRQFNEDFIGLTGSMVEVRNLMQQLGIAANFRATDADDYEVDHTGSVFLIGPQTRLLAVFSPPLLPGEIASRIQKIQNFIAEQN